MPPPFGSGTLVASAPAETSGGKPSSATPSSGALAPSESDTGSGKVAGSTPFPASPETTPPLSELAW
jgi:hypothetical protein